MLSVAGVRRSGCSHVSGLLSVFVSGSVRCSSWSSGRVMVCRGSFTALRRVSRCALHSVIAVQFALVIELCLVVSIRAPFGLRPCNSRTGSGFAHVIVLFSVGGSS